MADKKAATRLIKTARGQLDGILKMIEEDRYCIDIANQLQATTSILRKVNKEILSAHMKNCVAEAFESGNTDAKINELVGLMDKLSK